MFRRKTLYGGVIQLRRVSFKVESHHDFGGLQRNNWREEKKKKKSAECWSWYGGGGTIQ